MCAAIFSSDQVREPFTAVRFIAERGVDLAKFYKLPPPPKTDLPAAHGITQKTDDENELGEWTQDHTAYSICAGLARQRSLTLAKSALPDAHAAGIAIIKDAIDGILPFSFLPPSL